MIPVVVSTQNSLTERTPKLQQKSCAALGTSMAIPKCPKTKEEALDDLA